MSAPRLMWFPPTMEQLKTPDGRYIVVRGRLWRAANPNLTMTALESLVSSLMSARREVRDAAKSHETVRLAVARAAVHEAKTALGERGPVWWDDGAKDLNRHLVKNTAYATWYESTSSGDNIIDPLSSCLTRPEE